jgi:integrase
VSRNLTKFFGDDRLITSITAGDAEDFRIWLETEAREVGKDQPPAGLATNTVRRRVGRAREFFNLAVRRKIVKENPFAGESVTVGGNPDRQFFVVADWIERCIVACGCEDWRIMLAFARYAGMRSHETRLQRWEDIDLPNRTMIVRSQKNPPQRVCPIFPELLPHLMRAKEMAPEGAELVVTRYTPDAGLNETFKKIVKRAGLTAWPKLMQNLRATRETELIALYPIKDVASWLGNSAPIAMKHYAMTMKSSFDRAIEFGASTEGRKPPQNPPHDIATNGDKQHIAETVEAKKPAKNRVFVPDGCPSFPLEVPRTGLEPVRT